MKKLSLELNTNTQIKPKTNLCIMYTGETFVKKQKSYL